MRQLITAFSGPLLVRPMTRAASIIFAMVVFVRAFAGAMEVTVTAPNSKYLTQVDKMLIPALMVELNKHDVNATVVFTFRVDQKGHQSAIQVSSTPRDRAAEDMIARAIRRLRLPPLPSGAVGPHKFIYIKHTLSPNHEKA